MKAPRLVMDKVIKSYGATPALKGVSLEIRPGEIMALLGPNGAGKTTLVSIVAGLKRPDSGAVSLDGIDVVARPREARRWLGLAPQDTGVYPTLTVAENLAYFARLGGVDGRELCSRIEEVGQAFAVGAWMDRRANELSGGEKRRLHNAMAVLHRPPLLLLDEPTAGVDVAIREVLLETVRKLAAGGSAVCYSTHYLKEVEALGASVALLDGGELIARGETADLVARHSRPALELRFEGTAPDPGFGACEVRGDLLRIYTERPAVEAAAVLERLGPAGARLRSLEVVGTSLEGVFLALTGRRYGPRDPSERAEQGCPDPTWVDDRSLDGTPERSALTG